MKAIAARNLTKVYKIYSRRAQKFKEMVTLNRRVFHDTKRALSELNFDVAQGECLGVIGDNGSGKSTLLKILAQTSYPTAGELEINGKVSYILDPTTGFNPDFSGRENVHIKCALLGMTSAQINELFDVIHDFSGLGERIDHPIKTYSFGMVVRLGFSVAIHVPFDILLVDEVLAVGDYLFQRKCINAIRAFKEQNKTIVVASHSLSDVSTFCDRLILLQEGRMAMIGKTDSVVQQYIEACEKRYSSIEAPIMRLSDESISCCLERTGQAHLVEVQLLDGAGHEATSAHSGQALTVRVRFRVDEPIGNPCLRVQFRRNDGLLIAGTNTFRHQLDFGPLEKGVYEASCEFSELNLLTGDYYINVGIWPDEYQSYTAKTPYDIHEFRYILSVVSDRRDGGGLVRMPNRWSLSRLGDLS
ncbi:MAG TPA: ABC transporter ATP-binding protein [bacterium]|nr:ABC transporter ATP-binding protein [bacterium]